MLLHLATLMPVAGHAQALTARVSLDGKLTPVRRLSLPTELRVPPSGAFGEGGALVIGNGLDAQLLILDSTLQRVVVAGRKGEGPGEFKSLTLVFWSGDSILAHDNVLKRVSFFNVRGQYLKSISQAGWKDPSVVLFGRSSAGTWLTLGSPSGSRDSIGFQVVKGPGPQPSPFFGLQYFSRRPLTLTFGRGRASRRSPLNDPPHFSHSAFDQAVISLTSTISRGDTARIEIRWFGMNGVLGKRTTFPWIVSLLGPAKRDSLVEDLVAVVAKDPVLGRGTDLRAIREQVARDLVVPQFVPPISWTQADRDGVVWFAAKSKIGNPMLCRLLDKPTPSVHCASLPPRSTPVAADIGGRIIMAVADQDGMYSLVEYKLVP